MDQEQQIDKLSDLLQKLERLADSAWLSVSSLKTEKNGHIWDIYYFDFQKDLESIKKTVDEIEETSENIVGNTNSDYHKQGESRDVQRYFDCVSPPENETI